MDWVQAVPTSRRELLAVLTLAAAIPSTGRAPSRIEAIAFDAFVLFSAGGITRRAAEMIGADADSFVATASARIFSYTWLYTSASRYTGFQELARDAFDFTARERGLNLSSLQLDHLVDGYSALELWPDVADALHLLRERGIRLAILSNLPRHALESSLGAGRSRHHFEHVLSTDEVKRFKPAREAYAIAISRFGLDARSIGFAASAGWDAAGATWFGYPSVWVNRGHAPAEAAHARSQIISNGMEGVLQLAS